MQLVSSGMAALPTDADAVYIWLSLSIHYYLCLISRDIGIAPTCGASGYAVNELVPFEPSLCVGP
jgi:hypothetical protein